MSFIPNSQILTPNSSVRRVSRLIPPEQPRRRSKKKRTRPRSPASSCALKRIVLARRCVQAGENLLRNNHLRPWEFLPQPLPDGNDPTLLHRLHASHDGRQTIEVIAASVGR